MSASRSAGERRALLEAPAAAAVIFALIWITRPLPSLSDYARIPLIDPAGVLQVYPWHAANLGDFRRGHFPLWNPGTGLGQPHLANSQTAALFPLYWSWFLAGGGETLYGAILVFRVWLAGMFWFLFLRRKVGSFPASLLGAAGYAAGGYCLWFMELVDLNSQMLLPLLMLSLDAGVKKARISGIVLSGLLAGLAVYGGHPEAAFITVMVAVLYALAGGSKRPLEEPTFREGNRASPAEKARVHLPSRLLLIAAAGALGALFSLAVLLPFLNYLSRCWSMHGSGFGFFHLDARAWLNLVFPGLHRAFPDLPREIPLRLVNLGLVEMMRKPWAETRVPGNLPGAGVALFGLAMVAAANLRRLPRTLVFFCGLFFALSGLTLGLPGFRLAALIPPLNMNSNFKFFFSEIHASLCVLAAAGFDLVRETRAGKGRGSAPAVRSLAVALLPPGLLLLLFRAGGVFNGLPSRAVYGFGLDFLLLLFAAASLLAARGLKRARPIAGGLALGFVFASLYLNSREVRPFVALQSPEKPVRERIAAFVKTRAGTEARVSGDEDFWPPNLMLLSGLKDVRSSDALFLSAYMNLINRINGLGPEEGLGYFYPAYFTRPSPERLGLPAGREAAVRFLVSPAVMPALPLTHRVLFQGSGLYGTAAPGRETFLVGGELISRPRQARVQVPGLFLHSPAMVSLALGNDRARESQPRLWFVPALKSSGGDGALFLAAGGTGGGEHLLYSRFLAPGESAPSASPSAGGLSRLHLMTLPGPRNNRDSDWAGFVGLSLQKPGEPGFLRPAWEDEKARVFVYELDAPAWAHLSGSEEPLPVSRTAGDAFTVEVKAGRGGTLVIHEAWYPGWRAEIDGRQVKIKPSPDGVRWEAPLPPDAQEVSFQFLPADFRLGLFVAITTLAMFIPALYARRIFAGSRVSRR